MDISIELDNEGNNLYTILETIDGKIRVAGCAEVDFAGDWYATFKGESFKAPNQVELLTRLKNARSNKGSPIKK